MWARESQIKSERVRGRWIEKERIRERERASKIKSESARLKEKKKKKQDEWKCISNVNI